MLQPTFYPKLPEWRGNSSSADMNENFEQILYDFNTIFEEATIRAVELDELQSTIKHETDALNERLYAVSGVVSAFLQSDPGYKMFHEEFYRTGNVIFPSHVAPSDRCYVDTAFGLATLPVSNSFSKVYTIDINTGEVRQSPDLSVSVTALDEAGALYVDEGKPLRAFNGNNQSFWQRIVSYGRDYAKYEVSCQMDILLPSMSNPNVNSMFIFPYPEGTTDIQLITYNTLASHDNVLPGFPPGGINNATRKKYFFNEIQPVGFTVKIKQDTHMIEDDYRTFVYGAQEIGIEKNEYKSIGWFGVRADLAEWDTGVFSRLTSFRTYPMYDNITIKAYIYPTLGDFDADVPVWASTASPIIPSHTLDISSYATESVYILVELIQGVDSTSTPRIESLTLTYTTE